MTRSPSFISSLICTLVAVVACGSDDSSDTPAVVEPTTLAIAELRPSGGDAWRAGDPEPVALGCDRLLGVALELTNWTLRPRGACGSLDQCGYVHAQLTTTSGAAVNIDTALASFVFDLGGMELSSDEAATIRVELRDGDAEPFEQPAGEVLADELDVELDGSVGAGCESGAAGAGGQSGATGTGGSGGDATEGGAGGASAGAANEAGSGGVPGAGGDATSSGGAGSPVTDGGAAGDSAASGAAGEAGGP